MGKLVRTGLSLESDLLSAFDEAIAKKGYSNRSEAIRDLIHNYSRGVDRQDFLLLRSLYAPDAMEDDHGGGFSGTAEHYVDWLESVMGRVQNSSHMIHNHQVVLASATTAQGEVYLSGHTRLKANLLVCRQNSFQVCHAFPAFYRCHRRARGVGQYARPP